MQLTDLLDGDLLARHVRDGLVSARSHPSHPLVIYNYTPACQYSGAWDDVTRQCRGLIVHEGWADVVARPWPKFYNYGEYEEGALDMGALVEVTDKIDGSLGILYPVPFGYAVATRGSFISEQAKIATALWRMRYSNLGPEAGWTPLFEIVYPGNRVVVDYEDVNDLVYLGAVSIETGEVRGPYERVWACDGDADADAEIHFLATGPVVLVDDAGYWPGRKAKSFDADTLAAALKLEPRANAEGAVIRYLATGEMIKIKQDDYVELHRIVCGISPRGLWERLGAGETVADICIGLPDEFASWVQTTATELEEEADTLLFLAELAHAEILCDLRRSTDADIDDGRDFRAAYAERAKQHKTLAPYLFMLLDGKDPQGAIWRAVRP